MRELAASLDAEDHPVEAARAYEEAIARPEADLDTYINLAVLYFVCNDGGYAAHHYLPQSFLSVAWDRMFQVLDEAEARFGWHPEIEFWRRYFGFIHLGQEPFDEECLRLAKASSTLVPYFYLYAFGSPGESERYRAQAEELLDRVRAGRTAKERYIRSVLESALRAHGQRHERAAPGEWP